MRRAIGRFSLRPGSVARPRRRCAIRGSSGQSESSTGPRPSDASHYFSLADTPGQFDAVIHIDETRAVEPLERTAAWETGEPPETYPTAL